MMNGFCKRFFDESPASLYQDASGGQRDGWSASNQPSGKAVTYLKEATIPLATLRHFVYKDLGTHVWTECSWRALGKPFEA